MEVYAICYLYISPLLSVLLKSKTYKRINVWFRKGFGIMWNHAYQLNTFCDKSSKGQRQGFV